MDRRGDLSTHRPPEPERRPPPERTFDMDWLPRQREDITDAGPPDNETVPGKMSDTLKRVELPPNV